MDRSPRGAAARVTRIAFHAIEPTPEVQALVETKIAKLIARVGRIRRVDVDIGVPHRHDHSGLDCEVRLRIVVAGDDSPIVVARRETRVVAAINGATRAAQRELTDLLEIERDCSRQLRDELDEPDDFQLAARKRHQSQRGRAHAR